MTTGKVNNNVGISPDYVSGWTIEEAIREIVQNMIDAKDEFDCDGYVKYDGEKEMGIVKDYGDGLEMRHLVMGVSEKKDEAIGQFGEGLKLAMLVFAREGRHIEVWSKGKKITPVIKYDDNFETKMISLEVEELPPHWAKNHSGTSIKFECDEKELEAGKNYFIDYYKRDESEFEWISKDFVSMPGGQIWVNGSWVGEIDDAAFSYHFSGKQAREAINRDRGSIDTEKLANLFKKKLGETRSLNLMKGILKKLKNNEDCWETRLSFYEHRIESDNKSLWKRAVTEVFGDALLSSNSEADSQAKYKGYKIVNIRNWSWESLLENFMTTTIEKLRNENTKTKKVNQKDLDKNELNNLKKAKKLISKHYSKPGRVIVMSYIDNGTDSVIRGVYRGEKDEILILRKVLGNFDDTLQVLLHETVHKVTGFDDCTSYYEQALTEIAANLMTKI